DALDVRALVEQLAVVVERGGAGGALEARPHTGGHDVADGGDLDRVELAQLVEDRAALSPDADHGEFLRLAPPARGRERELGSDGDGGEGAGGLGNEGSAVCHGCMECLGFRLRLLTRRRGVIGSRRDAEDAEVVRAQRSGSGSLALRSLRGVFRAPVRWWFAPGDAALAA